MELSWGTGGGSSGFQVPRMRPGRGSEDGSEHAGASSRPPAGWSFGSAEDNNNNSSDSNGKPSSSSKAMGSGYFHHFAAGGGCDSSPSQQQAPAAAPRPSPLPYWCPRRRPPPSCSPPPCPGRRASFSAPRTQQHQDAAAASRRRTDPSSNPLQHQGAGGASQGWTMSPRYNPSTLLSKPPMCLLRWLSRWQQRLSSSQRRLATLRVFYQVLSHVHQFHQSHNRAWGSALLKSFTVDEAHEVVMCPNVQLGEDHGMEEEEEDLELFLAPEGEFASPSSDVFLLGCLLFRLLQPPGARAAAREAMQELRDRILPLEFLQQRPLEAAAVLGMLHPAPERRPSVAQVASNALFAGAVSQQQQQQQDSEMETCEEEEQELREEEEEAAAANRRALKANEEEEEEEEDASEEMAAEPLVAARLRDSALSLERAEVVTDVLLEFLRSMRDTLAKRHAAGRQQCNVMGSDLMLVLQALRKTQGTGGGGGGGGPGEEKGKAQQQQQRQEQQPGRHPPPCASSGAAVNQPPPQQLQKLKRKRHTCPGAPDLGMLGTVLERPAEKPKGARRRVTVKDLDMFSCLEPEVVEEEEEEDDGASDNGGESSPGPLSQRRLLQDSAAAAEASEDRWRRLERQVPAMESMYLQRWKEFSSPSSAPPKPQPRPPPPLSRASSSNSSASSPSSALRWAGLPGHLCSFAEDLGKFSKYGSLATHASLVQSGSGAASFSQMISSMSFGCGDEMFATAGTATRKIKLYQVQPLLTRGYSAEGLGGSRRLSSAAHYPLLEMETESKLSSICWNQYLRNYLVSADYGGVVGLWDTAKGELITSFSEHTKRAWSVDCSALDPKRMLSAGDDSTLRIWSVSDPCSGAVVRACAPIYSARFSPTDANVVAVGCANYRTFLYDLRNTARPLLQIGGHKKAVSYVQFMGGDKLVTASIDSTVKLWDLPRGAGEQAALRCCFKDHVNEKIFVGLAVREDGYILCGSETNEVHCYYSGLPVPILKHDFGDSTAYAARRPQASSVCWSSTSNLFLAANTAGRVDLLEMTTS